MRIRSLLSLSRAILLSTFFLGCGGPGAASPEPPKAPLRELPADASSLLALAPSNYGASALGGAIPGDAGSAAAQATFAGLMPGSQDGSLTHEVSLDLAAAVIARSFAERKQMPAESLVHWLFWRCGATTMPARYDLIVGPEGTPAEPFDRRLREVAATVQTKPVPLSFGAARVSFGGLTVQTLVLGRRLVDVAPMAKSYAPGSTVEVKSVLRVPFEEPKLYADKADATVDIVPFAQAEDGSLSASFQAPDKPGRYFIEIQGQERRPGAPPSEPPWHKTLAWVPIYVGVPEPTLVDEFIRQPAPNPVSVEEWRAQILSAYNGARTQAGRAPLVLEERASSVAQARAEEVSKAQGAPQADPAVVEKLANAGMAPRDILDTLSSVEFVSEYLRLRLLRPAARHYVLSANTTVLGVGVVPRPNPFGRPSFVMAEYVVEPVPPFDEASLRALFHEELSAREEAEGRAKVEPDEALTKSAQVVAEEVCAGKRKTTDVGLAWNKVGEAASSYLHQGSFAWAGYDFSKSAVDTIHEKMKGKGYTRAGVGICQGTIEGRANSVYALILQMGP